MFLPSPTLNPTLDYRGMTILSFKEIAKPCHAMPCQYKDRTQEAHLQF